MRSWRGRVRRLRRTARIASRGAVIETDLCISFQSWAMIATTEILLTILSGSGSEDLQLLLAYAKLCRCLVGCEGRLRYVTRLVIRPSRVWCLQFDICAITSYHNFLWKDYFVDCQSSRRVPACICDCDTFEI